jgi:Methyltransferase domain
MTIDTRRIFERSSRMGILTALDSYEKLNGHLSIEEAEVLFQAAKQVQEGVIVEVGSAGGKSAVALAKGSALGHKAPVFAVDPHEPFTGLYGGRYGPHTRRAFYETMLRTGCWETVRLINLSSEILSSGWLMPVELLWIDGDHRYPSVKRDLDCWFRHVITGGLIVFHDASCPNSGPGRVIEWLLQERLAHLSGSIGDTVAVKKL